MDVISGILQSTGEVLHYTWWLWLFFLLFPFFESTWTYWRQEVFKHHIDFILLELRMPREIRKSPKAMEQVLTAIHALRNAPADINERYFEGEITRWYALEMVSFGGEVHFYLRCYSAQKDIIGAALYSYYPDIEVVEVEDYTSKFPNSVGDLEETGYDMWGAEMLLTKESAYPIKSYLDFEAMEEEKQYDPISLFVEVMGKLKKGETVAIQYLIAPASPTWKDEFEHVIEKLRSRQPGKSEHGGAKMRMEFPHILPIFPVEKSEKKGDESPIVKSFLRTPGETSVLEAIEENLSMPAFETLIRFVYFSPKELFADTFPRRGLLAAFNQYGSLDLNSFRRNEPTATRTRIWNWPHVFPKTRNKYRKQRLLINFRKREIPEETWMGNVLTSTWFNWNVHSKMFLLNTRSLATLFHPPTFLVLTGPHVKRVESKKMGPPAGLPIYGEEEEIERFK